MADLFASDYSKWVARMKSKYGDAVTTSMISTADRYALLRKAKHRGVVFHFELPSQTTDARTSDGQQ